MRKNIVFLSILLFLPLIHIMAQGPRDEQDPLIIELSPRIIGLDVGFGYRGLPIFSGVDTIIWLTLGGGYESIGFYRKPDGTPYSGSLSGYDPKTSPYYWRINSQFSVGLAQGLLWNDRIEKNLVEIFLFYKFRYDTHLEDSEVDDPQLIFDGDFVDKDGVLHNSILLGIIWQDIDKKHIHKIWSGTEADISVEWGPEFLANSLISHTDFLRLNLTARAFLPILDAAPDAVQNMFSIYFGAFLAIDYLTGANIPINILQTFGGRYPRQGLGFALRGYEYGRFSSRFKVVNNLEIRMNLPELGKGVFMPGLVFYFDTGYYNFLDYSEEQNLLFTTGAGLFINVFDITNFTFYTQFLLNGTRLSGDFYNPIGMEFNLHF